MTEYQTHPHYHLLTAMYNWIVENGGVPQIIVPLTEVPTQLHRLGNPNTGTITLNIAPHAVGMFDLGVERLTFRARFQGVDTALNIATDRIELIYDRESPAVMMQMPTIQQAPLEPEPETPKRPTLSVVK